MYLVYRACSLPAWLVSFLNHALSCTCTISVCQYTTLQLRLSRRCNQNATVEGCSVLSDCRKAGVQTKDGVRTLGPVWMPIRRAEQTTALVSAVAQSQLWRSSTSPSLASKRQNPSPGKDRVAHNEGVALAARRRWLPTASAATKSADHEE